MDLNSLGLGWDRHILFTMGLEFDRDKLYTCEDVVEAVSLVVHGGDFERLWTAA